MPQLTLFVTPPESIGPWLAMLGFGAYHGLNPGMGWLFALSLGLQQRSSRAVWTALLPIAAGHAASLALVAALVVMGLRFVTTTTLQLLTAAVLLAFGAYKVFNYYRHPRWVGMKVGMRDLTAWSFLMAMAHGAGLMVAPTLVSVAYICGTPGIPVSLGTGLVLAVGVHTLAMLVVMAAVAWVVYTRLGLMVLRQSWINFDLIWAVALLLVGSLALLTALW
ncbi:MAG: hypothetical protein MI924_17985 [Chloroflexales bacterium]|nr:hypothetical protein [Chloroflexales bacterium]